MPRLLSERERKLVCDALRRAAAESRATAAEILDDPECPATLISRMREQATAMQNLAVDQDRLAAELSHPKVSICVDRHNERTRSTK